MAEHSPPLDENVVNAENPWPGLSAFSEEHARFFHGRDEEIVDILQLVRRRTLTVLFGQSGLGKTSLLQAGLFPPLRAEEFLPVYLRLNYADDAPDLVGQIRETLQQAARAPSPDMPGSSVADAPAPRAGESLWEYFHREENDFWSPRNRVLSPVLVFDQFEEMFTLAADGEERQRRVSRLLGELAGLVEDRPSLTGGNEAAAAAFNRDKRTYRVVFSLREDFLANLEGLRNQIPSIGGNRFRLTMMNGRQALQAVVQTGGGLVDPDVAAKIIDLVAVKGAGTPGEAEEVGVEPTLLSVFCRELNTKRLLRNEPKITSDLVVGSKGDIIHGFYARALRGLDPRVPLFIEEKLLTSSGYRNSVAIEDATTHPGIDQTVIDTLVNRRLFRIEGSSRPPRLELTHDVLTGVIKANRDQRRLAEAEAEMKRRAEEAQRRLREQAEEAQRKLQAQEEEARRQLHAKEQELADIRRRNLLLLCAGAVCLILAAISFWEYRAAQAEQRKAEQSFQGADSLIDFMLVDLPDRLQPVGQLQVLAATAQKVIDYQTHLPADVVSDPARQLRLAQAYNFQGSIFAVEARPDQAGADFQRALAIMQPLAGPGAGGDFLGELARSLYNQAALVFSEDAPGHLQSSLDEVRLSLAKAQAVTKPADDTRWNRFLVAANQLEGRILAASSSDPKDALPAYQACVDLITARPGDPQNPFNLGVTYRLMGDVCRSKDDPQAENDYQLAIAQLKPITAGNTPALFELSVTDESLAALYSRLNREDDAVAAYLDGRQSLQILTRLDASNIVWLSALAAVDSGLGEIYFKKNSFDQAEYYLKEGLGEEGLLLQRDPADAQWQYDDAVASREVGNVFMVRGDLAGAEPFYVQGLDQLRDLLKKSPNSHEDIEESIHVEVVLGDVSFLQGKTDQAQAYYAASLEGHRQAIALAPGVAGYHNEYSWDLSTCPMAQERNGPLALQEIKLAVQLTQGRDINHFLDTRAAAEAETGDFKDAIADEQRAIAVLGTSSAGPLGAMQARLALYRQGKPYHRAKPQDAFY